MKILNIAANPNKTPNMVSRTKKKKALKRFLKRKQEKYAFSVKICALNIELAL